MAAEIKFEPEDGNLAPDAREVHGQRNGSFASLRALCNGKIEADVKAVIRKKLKDTPWADSNMVILTTQTFKDGQVIDGAVQRIQLESHFGKGKRKDLVFMELMNWSVGKAPSCEISFGDEGTLPRTKVVPTLNAMLRAFRLLLGPEFTKEFPPCTIVASTKDWFHVRPK